MKIRWNEIIKLKLKTIMGFNECWIDMWDSKDQCTQGVFRFVIYQLKKDTRKKSAVWGCMPLWYTNKSRGVSIASSFPIVDLCESSCHLVVRFSAFCCFLFHFIVVFYAARYCYLRSSIAFLLLRRSLIRIYCFQENFYLHPHGNEDIVSVDQTARLMYL